MAKANLEFFRHWLPLAVVITLVSGLIYSTVQQNYRQSANDPQIQMAEDAAMQLNHGTKSPSQAVPTDTVDIASSLAPFMIVYDVNGQVAASSGKLGDTQPSLPGGVLDYVKQHGQDRFTWQPQSDARIATVVTSYNQGYVLVGRNMREVEKREDSLSEMVLIGWLVTLAATLFLELSAHFYQRLLGQ